MTRKEQIEEASVTYQISKRPNAIGGDAFADLIYKANINPSFIAGAEWADKTMIEKAVEWFKDQKEMIGISFQEDFIERFKKAMEK